MSRQDAAMLAQVADVPQLYLRRCNDQPRSGITVMRETVESVLSLARAAEHLDVVVVGDLETGLSIRLPAGRPWEVEAGGTAERTFTYTPMPTGQHRTQDA